MKKCAMMIGLAVLAGLPNARGFNNHYVNGSEGIKAATLPPPGMYYRLYTQYYAADKLMNASGDSFGDFEVDVFALVNRLVWISKVEFLGGNYGADVIIPFVKTDFNLSPPYGPGSDDEFGLADIVVEPLLISWHGARYDASAAAGAYLPTGEFDTAHPAYPGKGLWTALLTLGGTLYPDQAKTWSASVLSRYEIHGEQDDTNITPGDDFHFEWGVGKTVSPGLDIGVSGYCQWQVTNDRGAGSTNDKDEVYAAGPEVQYAMPQRMLFLSLRVQKEFAAVDRPEGMITTLTLTKGL